MVDERDAQIIAEQQARELLGRAKSACDNRPDCECARDDEGYLRICEWDVTLVAAALPNPPPPRARKP